MVRMIDGDPSWLESWLLWRKFSTMEQGVQKLFDSVGYRFPEPFHVFLDKAGREQCPFCQGWGEISDPNFGQSYCLCSVLNWTWQVEKQARPFRSYVENADLSRLMLDRGVPAQKDNLAAAIDAVEYWMEWPQKWLVLSGGNGAGKTTMLASIRKKFHPIAVYVTAHDFEQRMYTGQDDGTFNDYLELLGQVPILLFDDWGAEYGKPLVHAKASSVIDRRDRIWRELITVVATNLPMAEFKSYNQRMGSRLMDPEKVISLPIIAPDHRLPERR
jgi:DNA replication protein DnaC